MGSGAQEDKKQSRIAPAKTFHIIEFVLIKKDHTISQTSNRLNVNHFFFISISDKAPSEAVFRGSEFLSYDLTQTGGEPIVSAQDSVTFYFKTRGATGLLFYTGKLLLIVN